MQNLNQKPVNNLVKGLITEAGELTFPEGASVDELNCFLERDGSRSRRFGLQFETSYSLSSFSIDPTKVISTGRWTTPGGVAGLTFMVLQAGSTLYFYDADVAPYSGQYTGLSVDLSTFEVFGRDSSQAVLEYATISSVLVVASNAIDTVYLTYDGTSITAQKITFRTRDFEWQSSICDLTESIPTGSITNRRKYDTLNSGWIGNSGSTLENYAGARVPSGTGLDALKFFVSYESKWPPLTHPWYSGKNSSGIFDLDDWKKVSSGSSLLGNGHFILDFFSKNRNAVSGLTGIPTQNIGRRFTSVSAFSGRMFYAGLGAGPNSGKVLYSKIIENIKTDANCSTLGDCFQQNDPVSEYFSDLLETDGGVINIPEAYNINKLYTHNQYLYVFAENGIWVISGPDNRFSPTNFYVSKVSNVGLYASRSFVSAEGVPFWWSKYGIHTFSYDETSGYPIEQNLSLSTIQSFWDKIDVSAKNRIRASYDRVNKRIFWMYPENGEDLRNKRTRILILDIPLQAFYPWKIADNDNYPMDLFFFDAYGSETIEDNVTDNSLGLVTDGASNSVYVPGVSLLASSQTRLGVITFSNDKVTISAFASKSFVDWGTDNYESYAECGYDFAGDMLLKKTAPYVVVYCRSTEEGFSGSPSFTPINSSGLFVEVYWDFKDYPTSRQQAYRIKPTPVVDVNNLSDNGQNKTVVTSRLKVRGSGRSMRFRFVAEDGKNFVLLGYSVLVGANARF